MREFGSGADVSTLRDISPPKTSRGRLVASGVTVHFARVTALSDVGLTLAPGSVHGLIGPNGAGKSTLVGVLTGTTRPSAGSLYLDKEEVRLHGPADARHRGIVAVAQELAVLKDMSLADVVTLGAEPSFGGLVQRRRRNAAAQAALARVGLAVPPSTNMGSLSPSAQRAVMVAQALHRKARVLLLDEPTAGMDADHSQRVLEVVELLRAEGNVAILYISHRFDEVERLCDTVTVLRDGSQVGMLTAGTVTRASLLSHLIDAPQTPASTSIGRMSARAARSEKVGDCTLSVEDLSAGWLRGVTFDARVGEVLGVAGLAGSGVEDVFAVLAGTLRPSSGRIRSADGEVTSPRTAARAGIGSLPASRTRAVLSRDDVARNLVLGYRGAGFRRFVRRATERRLAEPVATRLATPPVDRRMSTLSGGNQQKVLIGRLMLADKNVLVAEDPTVGVDVAARRVLHTLLRQAAADGCTCVVGSSEPEELLEICDRILVLRHGSVVAELRAGTFSAAELLAAMTASDKAAS